MVVDGCGACSARRAHDAPKPTIGLEAGRRPWQTSAFCSVGPAAFRAAAVPLQLSWTRSREAAPERGESGLVPAALRPQGVLPCSRVVLQGEGSGDRKKGLAMEAKNSAEMQIMSSWMPRVQQELWLQLHSALRGSVAALEASYTKQCWDRVSPT